MFSLANRLGHATLAGSTSNRLVNFTNQMNALGAIVNPDGLAVYNSLLQALRESAACVFFPYAYSADGATVYGMDNIGNKVPFSFSRAGSATVVDKDGKMKYAMRQNLIAYSEDLTQSIYSKGAVTCDVNKIKEDGTNNNHYIVFNTTTPVIGAAYGLSADFKPAERTSIKFGLNMSGIGGITATVNLSTGTITNLVNAGSGFSGYSATITLVNGWYRVNIKGVAIQSNDIYGDVYLLDGSGNVLYTGIAGNGVYMNRVQWKTEPSYNDYVKTTGVAITTYVPRFAYDPATLSFRGLRLEQAGTNINPYSQLVRGATGSGWALSGNVTVTDDNLYSITHPYFLAKVTQVDNTGYVFTNNITFTASAVYTASIFVKAGTAGRYFNLSLQNTDYVRVWFDLQSGAVLSNQVGNTGTGISFVAAGIENYGNGIYRVNLTINSGTNTSLKVVAFSTINDATITRSTGSIYIDHLQVETGAASSFILTNGSIVTRAAESFNSNTDIVAYSEASVFMYGAFNKQDYSSTNAQIITKDGNGKFLYSNYPTPLNAYQWDGSTYASFGASLDGNFRKYIASYGAAGQRSCHDGSAVATSTYDGTFGASTTLKISPSAMASLYIKAVLVMPRQLSDAELQSFTF